jgi:hypothetical protein
MEKIIQKEMPFQRWFAKILERGQIIQLSIKEKMEIKEDDWEIIRTFHRMHALGYMPMYDNIPIEIDETSQNVTQQSLFSDNQADNTHKRLDGIEVEKG